MKKIFITGVAGFLGSFIAERMLQNNCEVIGVDNLIGGYLDNVPDGVEFYQMDCGYLNSMVKLSKGCDVVIHTACTAYEGLSVFSPHLIFQNTAQNSMAVISAAIQNKVKRFVYCSSMARYGEQPTTPFSEEMTCRPQDPYGIAKLATENVLKELADLNGMQWVVAVPHNIIGPRQKYDDPYRNVASIMINLMLQGRQPFIYGSGEQTRCFSFIDDVIEPLEKLALDNSINQEVVNIGPDEGPVTINELAKQIAEILDFNLSPIYLPGRPKEVFSATCSANKARELLGYKTSTTLRNGLESMVEYIRAKGTKRFRYHLDIEIINELTPKTWNSRLM